MRPGFVVSFAFAAALAAGAAAAQTLYKLIDKNGKVTYSETKPKAGEFDGQVIELNIDPNANRATLPKADFSRPERDKAAAAAAQSVKLQEAQARLGAAQRALDAAKANPETQRMGSVGGGAREVPTEDYRQRLEKLEQKVKEAEEEVRLATPR